MNNSEEMAATAVAEPSTQVERKARIAINGLGRIGRTFLKLAIARDELDVVESSYREATGVKCVRTQSHRAWCPLHHARRGSRSAGRALRVAGDQHAVVK